MWDCGIWTSGRQRCKRRRRHLARSSRFDSIFSLVISFLQCQQNTIQLLIQSTESLLVIHNRVYFLPAFRHGLSRTCTHEYLHLQAAKIFSSTDLDPVTPPPYMGSVKSFTHANYRSRTLRPQKCTIFKAPRLRQLRVVSCWLDAGMILTIRVRDV